MQIPLPSKLHTYLEEQVAMIHPNHRSASPQLTLNTNFVDPYSGHARHESASSLLSHTRNHSDSIGLSELRRPNNMMVNETRSESPLDSDQRPRPRHRGSRVSLQHFLGKDRIRIGWRASINATMVSSWINILIVLTPLAWALHWEPTISPVVKFFVLFASIIPLISMFEWGGEQLSLYCGKDLGDLICVTLSNLVEVLLAFFLLMHCELRILQSTIVGVILLRLLLIPGVAFYTGGRLVGEQTLNAHFAGLNQSLLTVGVLAILVPTALFAALNRGDSGAISAEVIGSDKAGQEAAAHAAAAVEHVRRAAEAAVEGATGLAEPVGLSDTTRSSFLAMSHGIAVILMVIYIGSRVYLHNPPRKDWDEEREDSDPGPVTPAVLRRHHEELAHATPKTNVWVCIVTLICVTVIMAFSVQWLVENIEFVRQEHLMQDEWFGLFLLPLISFSADAVLSTVFFCRSWITHWFGAPPPTQELAQARAIDVGVQFALFWLPVIVVLAWILKRPFILLFDTYEVTMLLGACFLLNYVTGDGKTNWSEGMCLIGFYFIIALCTWFYPGQPELQALMKCTSVAQALLGGGEGGH